jgi:S1-C subfamily serine protease
VGSVPKVFLTCEEGDGWASAVVLDESGLLVTNDHVAEPEDCTLTRLQVGFARSSGDAPTPALDAVVVAVDADHDLAVLQVVDRSRRPVGGRRPIALGDSDALQIGQRMTVLGFPGSGGDTITFTDGAVSGFEPNGSVTRGWIKTSAVMSPGSSGGGWFDAGGRLVGLTSWGSDGGINRGVPVNLVKPLLATARRVVAAGGLTTAPPTTRPTPSTTLPPVPPGTIRVSGAFVSSGKQGGLPVDRVDALPAGATVACAFWVTQGIAAGTVVDVVWTVDGVELPSATERGFRWRAVDGDRVNWCAPKNGVAAGPLPTGQHVLALVVGGRRVEVARVRVG